MPVPKKSSSAPKAAAKKPASSAKRGEPAVKKTPAKKTSAKKPVKRVIKPKPILSRTKESDLKKFALEEEDYRPEDSFAPVSFSESRPSSPDEEAIAADGPEEEAPEKSYNRDEYDFQRKFYHSLALEAKEQGAEELAHHSRSRSISFYRKFALRFTAAVAVLIAVVAFFSFSKLTISVVPNEDLISDSLVMSVQDESASTTPAEASNTVKGIVRSIVIEDEKNYSATGEQPVNQGFNGQVFVINNNNAPQALVATTRLITSDNKLFRIKKAVNVPAGGEAAVEVYPDQATPDMAIAPTRFTIPGLNATLQAKIYAESREAFSFGGGTQKYISAEDLSNAKKDLSLALLEKAKTEAGQEFQKYDKVIYNVDITKIITTTDAKPGDNQAQFDMKARGSVQIIAFSQADAFKLINEKLKVSIPEGRILSGLNESSVSYSLESADEAAQVASVKTAYSGRTTLAPGVEIIDRNKIVNLNRSQIDDYLKTVDGISAYKLDFSPSFISKAPSLSDRIKVEIVNPTSTDSQVSQ